jgi:TatD DNase family protein
VREIKYFKPEDQGMSFFDTHAHIYDRKYEAAGVDAVSVLQRCAASGVKRILIPGDSMETSKAAVELSGALNGKYGVELYASVGVHPHEAKTYDDEVEKYLRNAIENREDLRIRAIGEIGLDYYYDLSERSVQRDVFEKQLLMAYEYDIPFILHERDATGDCLDILRKLYKEGRLRKEPGVCHCCSCSPEASSELIKMGFYIGFDGPLTFKNNKKTPEVLKITPLDRMVIETDSPYLTPEPNRGNINEPCHVAYVCAKLAEIKGITLEEAARITYDNGNRLYGLS